MACDRLPLPRYVAMQGAAPYDAAPLVGFDDQALSQSRMAHASRSTQSLFQLARQGGHGHRRRLLGHQLRGLGDRRRFPRFRPLDGGQDRAHRDHDRAFRSLYNERLQQYARQFGRPIGADQARALGLDRLMSDSCSRRSCSTSAPARSVSPSPMPRSPSRSRPIPSFLGPERPVRPFPVRADHPQRRLHRGALRRRAAPRLLRRQLAGTVSSGMSAPKALVEAVNRYQNEQRSIEYVLIDRAQAGEIPAAHAGRARQVFRGAQDPVPRARIPQARDRVVDPERAGALDRDFRCGPQARLRGAARPLRHPGTAPHPADRFSGCRGGAAPPPTASQKARPSSTSPRSSARPRRTSTSARWRRPA